MRLNEFTQQTEAYVSYKKQAELDRNYELAQQEIKRRAEAGEDMTGAMWNDKTNEITTTPQLSLKLAKAMFDIDPGLHDEQDIVNLAYPTLKKLGIDPLPLWYPSFVDPVIDKYKTLQKHWQGTYEGVSEGSDDPWGDGHDRGSAAGTMNAPNSKYPEGSKDHKLYMTGYKQGVKAYNNKVRQYNKSSKQQGVAEGSNNVGTSIKALYQKIYNAGDDEIEYFYNDSPIFAQYWDEYEGDLDSIIAEVDPGELQVILDELESYAQQAGLAESEKSPMFKDAQKSDRIRSLKNLIAIAKEQGRQLRAQELELELKKMQGVAEAGNNYHANRTGFAKPQRNDDEHHHLDTPRPLIYGLKINGKIWQKDGNTVTFFTKERALAARNSILAKRPDVEIGLVQRPKD